MQERRKKLEKFFWRNSKEKNNIYLINWKIVTTPKIKDGLGINNVKDTNFALLFKRMWRFLNETDPFWKRIILAKYEQSFLGDIPTKGKYNSPKAPWRSITKGNEWFLPQIKWRINNGEVISFWHGDWHEHNPLYIQRPRLYALPTKKWNSIKDLWNEETME